MAWTAKARRWKRGTFSVGISAESPRSVCPARAAQSPGQVNSYTPTLLWLLAATALLLPSASCPASLSAFAPGCCSASPPHPEPSGRTGTGLWSPGYTARHTEGISYQCNKEEKEWPCSFPWFPIQQSRFTCPSASAILARVNVTSESAADVNHLNPYRR